MTLRHVCIVTGTRADWGLLTPLARSLRDSGRVRLSIVATNMHLVERCGMTVREIEEAGFAVDERVPMHTDGDDAVARVRAMGECMQGMADAFGRLRPDCAIILGDRYEMLAVAAAAAMMRIPITHIAGGTVSEGAIDDAMRHAITKLSSLHLVETDDARRRVIQMGEHPATVIATGALGVWNIMHQKLMSRSQLEATLDGFRLDPASTLLVTYHPATLDDADPVERFDQLLAALDRFPDSNVLITLPNNDAGGDAIAARVAAYAAASPARVKAVASLGMVRYLSALRCVAAVVGNSSSGIVEVPSMHIPTVDVGMRQHGRPCSHSVIHCGDTADLIEEAIRLALSSAGRSRAMTAVNPYGRPDTVRLMTDAVIDFVNRAPAPKTFYNIPFDLPN